MSLNDDMYKQAKRDELFKEEFASIPDNEFPLFPSDIQKAMFVTAYYGWLVGKFGLSFAERIKQRVKLYGSAS